MVLEVLFLALLIVAAIIALSLAVYALRQSAGLSLRFFAIMLIGESIWAWALRGRVFSLVPITHRRLVEVLPDGVLIADAEQRVVTANAVARRLLGDRRVGVNGQLLGSLLPALTPAAPLVLTLGASDPHPATVEVTLTPLHDQRTRLQGWLVVLRDISARYAAEQALRERELMLRSISDNMPDGLIYQLERLPDGSAQFRYISAGVEQLWGATAEQVYADAQTIWSRIHPDDRPAFEQAAIRAHEAVEPFDMELRVLLPDGTQRWTNSRSSAQPSENGRVLRNGIEIDITAHKHIEEQLRRRIDELVALNQIAQALSSWTSLGEGLEAVAPLLLRLFSAETIALWQYDASDRRLVPLYPGGGEPVPLAPSEALLEGAGVDRPGATVVQLPASSPLLGAARAPGPAGQPRAAEHAEGSRALLVPLRSHNATIGLLCLTRGSADTLRPDEVALAQTVAGLLASAVENALLFAQAQAAAAERERRAIARELHDSVSQALYAANVAAETVPLIWELDPEEGRERLLELARFTRTALAEIRALLVELRPHALVSTPLHEALPLLVAATAAHGAVEVRTSLEAAPLLPPEVQIALYRITQEALNNVSKHAHATRLAVTLSVCPPCDAVSPWAGGVAITVADNGGGFDLGAARSGRLGLTMMRERADEIGAVFEVASQLGGGAVISVRWQGAARSQSSLDTQVGAL